jgi:CheY-like chemotaxis protein
VIDDQDFPYKELFERDGYTVTKWDDVHDLAQLESGEFDLILLDLLGVGGRSR